MQRWLVFALAIPLALVGFKPAAPSLIWWTADSLQKVRPFDFPPQKLSGSIAIFAARNEFEPFQIVFRADSQDVEGMDVEVSDFKAIGGALIPRSNLSIYFQRTLDLPRPSSIEGMAGEWPDILVPKQDRYFGEQRNAFPFKLSDGKNQAIWFEIYVPRTAPADKYHATATVSIKGQPHIEVPITLDVWDFELPSTASLPTSFGFSGISAVREHFGKYTSDEDVRRLTFLYRKAALWHRLSLHGGTWTPPPFHPAGDGIAIEWKHYDDEMAPFLDGQVFTSKDPLPGAKATTAELRTHNGLRTDRQKTLYWRAFSDHFRDKGWGDRLFNYLWDEPAPADFDDVLKRGRLVRLADPDLKNLVTAPLRSEWEEVIDIWSPLVNCFVFKPRFPGFCQPMANRAAYSAGISRGGSVWWYQSCASHGCNIIGGEYFTGWPTYMIDAAAISNRIMPWVAWKYDIGGELYFNINEAYRKNNDAWTNVYLFGGNGDGTLVYPGTPKKVGGKTDIPVESIRLKLIREGLEDYEYLDLMAKQHGHAAAAQVVDRLVTNPYTYDRNPSAFQKYRRELGERLSSKASHGDE